MGLDTFSRNVGNWLSIYAA